VAEVINLNRARKAKAKAAGKAAAAENRVKHGRTKGEKALGKLEAERARKELEGKKRPSKPAHPREGGDPG
jgi:hypothetical protein